MSRLIYVLIFATLVVATIAAVNTNSVAAQPQADFIQVSVLSERQADYGVDKHILMIPAISLEIMADKLHDEGKSAASLPVIIFTSGSPSDESNDSVPAIAPVENVIVEEQEHGNGSSNGHRNRNANGNSNGNGNGNGNAKSNGNSNIGNGNGNGNSNNNSNANGGGNGNGNGDNNGNANGNRNESGNGNNK